MLVGVNKDGIPRKKALRRNVLVLVMAVLVCRLAGCVPSEEGCKVCCLRPKSAKRLSIATEATPRPTVPLWCTRLVQRMSPIRTPISKACHDLSAVSAHTPLTLARARHALSPRESPMGLVFG